VRILRVEKKKKEGRRYIYLVWVLFVKKENIP